LGLASAGLQAVRDRHAPMAGALVLAFLAVIQVAVQPLPDHPVLGTPAAPPQIFLVLIALAATLPLGLLWAQPRTAAVIIVVADLLSLGLVHTSTVAGFIAIVVVVFRLGYLGAQALAACAALAFVVLALARTHASPVRSQLMVLAVALPLAAWAGYSGDAHSQRRFAAVADSFRQRGGYFAADGSVTENHFCGDSGQFRFELI